MRIHITYTGGTIGMVESPNGLVPGADMRGWLRRLIEDAHLDPSLFSFTELDPLIDSSNADAPTIGRRWRTTCARTAMTPTHSW